jgi:putative DNA primase/helicase
MADETGREETPGAANGAAPPIKPSKTGKSRLRAIGEPAQPAPPMKVPQRSGVAGVRQAAALAKTVAATPIVDEEPFPIPHGFEMRPDGLWSVPYEKQPLRICGPFEVIAESRPEHGDEWGLLLRWKDRDGRSHEWIMPRRLLAGEAVEVRARLAACGLDVSAHQNARGALVQFLAAVRIGARVRTVPRTGWYLPASSGAAFVLPDRCIGTVLGEVVRLDLDPLPTIYTARGTLDGWRREVASLCADNSRLLFGLSCAFAAPLLPLTGDEGGGINLRGESSKGKTTIIDVAASAWGAPSKTGADAFVRQWRTTSNALETTAAAHNHALLPMDEMGQADPREVGETLYMLANGTGKDRARAGGGNRRGTTWHTLVLSSSEESAGRMADQAGRRIKAGQEVRMLDIPAIVSGGFGCFDDLHGEPDGSAFAQRLRRGVIGQHGTAAAAFLDYIAGRLAREPDFIATVIDAGVREYCRQFGQKDDDGQVQRAARRMAMVALAGELATEAGITGWQLGAAAWAAEVVFRDWLAERGGSGSREDQHLQAAFRKFIGLHGSARFEAIREPGRDPEFPGVETLSEGQKTINRAGYRWQELTDGGEIAWVHGIIPEVFDAEVAAPLGMEGRDARARLGKAGLIKAGKDGGETRWAWRPRRIPGNSRPRLIVVPPETVSE